MFTDIVLPNKNEKDFIKIAETLGYKSLVLAYKDKANIPDISELQKTTKIKLSSAIYNDLTKAKQKSKKGAKPDLTITNPGINIRKVIEGKQANILVEIETISNKDSMHHRNSGLNQVLCKLLKEKDIAIAISHNLLTNTTGMLRAQVLGRIMLNIKLQRKYKFKIIIASFAETPMKMSSPHDLISLGIMLGMHANDSKNALNLFQ